MKSVLVDIVLWTIILGPLVYLCVLHWRKPGLFSSLRKCALWVLGLSLWSWLLFGGSMFVACAWFHHYPENGAAVVFALYLGWLYIWPFAILVGGVYLLVRILVALASWAHRRLFTHRRDNRVNPGTERGQKGKHAE